MKAYETYGNGKFEITLHDDIGGRSTETVTGVVSKFENGNSVTLRMVNGVRQVFAPDFVTFIEDK